MRLDDEAVRGFDLGRSHKAFGAPLNSLSFHRSHDLLAVATDDDEIHVFDIASGAPARAAPLPCRKYGAACVSWTHTPGDLLHASTKVRWCLCCVVLCCVVLCCVVLCSVVLCSVVLCSVVL